jgi:hypothetical protein
MRYKTFFLLLLSCAARASAESPKLLELTPGHAVDAIRGKQGKNGNVFRIVRKIDSSNDTRRVAIAAARDASVSHIKPYGDGILISLLERGGFLILEVDPGGSKTVSVHLVSRGANGKVLVDSYPLPDHDKDVVTDTAAVQLIGNTADFVETLLATAPSGFARLQSKFYDGRFPESTEPGYQEPFAIPRSLTSIAGDQAKITELAALFFASQIWGFRYATSLPIFAADPHYALQLAEEKEESLVEQYKKANSRVPDLDFESLESIRSASQVQERIDWLRQLDKFLEQSLQRQEDPNVSRVNRLLATVVLQVGKGNEGTYFAMTSADLIIGWKVVPPADYAVAAISFGE